MLQVPTMPVDQLPPFWGAAPVNSGPRTTRTVLEDLFRTYTGCDSISAFLRFQEEGAVLCAALREGAGLPVAAVQPRVQRHLQDWYESTKARRPTTAVTTLVESPAKGRLRPTARTSSAAHDQRSLPASAAASGVAAATADVDSVAKGRVNPDDADNDDGVVAHLLPPLEELPPVVRCSPDAILSLRRKVQFYFTRLYELVEQANTLGGRWGRLTTSERSRLKEAMQAEKRARVTERELLEIFEELFFNDEHLESVLPADIALCSHVRVLRCSNNPALRELSCVPAACHTVIACACRLDTLSAASAAVAVLGLSFNRLKDLSFVHQFPSLRVLDMTSNWVTNVDDVIKDINAHSELNEVSLAGNPIALLDHYRSRIASACPRIDKLDSQLILAEERGLGCMEGGATAMRMQLPPTNRRSSSRNKRHSAAVSGRPPSKKGAETAALEAAAAAAEAQERERQLALTVGAVVELLSVKGLSSLAHTTVMVNLTEDFDHQSEFLRKATGSTRQSPSPQVTVPPLDFASHSRIKGGNGPAGSGSSRMGNRSGSSSGGGSARRTGSQRKAAVPATKTGASVDSQPPPSGHARARPSSRGPIAQKEVSLYEHCSTLVIHGIWGGSLCEGEPPLEDGRSTDEVAAVHITTAAIPLSSSPNFIMADAVAALSSQPAAGKRNGAVVNGAQTTLAGHPVNSGGAPVPQPQPQSQHPQPKDTGFVSVGAVVDGVYRPAANDQEHRAFTAAGGGLPVTPDLAERLRRPFHLHLEVHDEMCFPDQAMVRASMEGGGVGMGAGGGGASSSTTQNHRANNRQNGAGGAQKRLSMALASAQQLEQQRQHTQHTVYRLGTITVDPAQVVLQPPESIPRAALVALSEQADASPAPGAAALSHTQSYRRELRSLGCALQRSAAEERAARLRLEEVRAELRRAVAEHESARAELLEETRRQEEAVATAYGGGGPGSVPLPLSGNALNSATSSNTSSPRKALNATAATTGSSNNHRRASLRVPVSGALQHSQAEASARHATVIALATKVAVLERRIEELWGKGEAAAPAPVTADLKLSIGRGPLPPAAVAAALQDIPTAPAARIRKVAAAAGGISG